MTPLFCFSHSHSSPSCSSLFLLEINVTWICPGLTEDWKWKESSILLGFEILLNHRTGVFSRAEITWPWYQSELYHRTHVIYLYGTIYCNPMKCHCFIEYLLLLLWLLLKMTYMHKTKYNWTLWFFQMNDPDLIFSSNHLSFFKNSLPFPSTSSAIS